MKWSREAALTATWSRANEQELFKQTKEGLHLWVCVCVCDNLFLCCFFVFVWFSFSYSRLLSSSLASFVSPQEPWKSLGISKFPVKNPTGFSSLTALAHSQQQQSICVTPINDVQVLPAGRRLLSLQTRAVEQLSKWFHCNHKKGPIKRLGCGAFGVPEVQRRPSEVKEWSWITLTPTSPCPLCSRPPGELLPSAFNPNLLFHSFLFLFKLHSAV